MAPKGLGPTSLPTEWTLLVDCHLQNLNSKFQALNPPRALPQGFAENSVMNSIVWQSVILSLEAHSYCLKSRVRQKPFGLRGPRGSPLWGWLKSSYMLFLIEWALEGNSSS